LTLAERWHNPFRLTTILAGECWDTAW